MFGLRTHQSYHIQQYLLISMFMKREKNGTASPFFVRSRCPLSSIHQFVFTHLNFSSGNPRVSSTKPHSNSLKAIPFCVPPQAVYSQSANTVGTPSFISWTKTVLLSSVPFVPVDRLNASLMRRNSLSVTKKMKIEKRKRNE